MIEGTGAHLVEDRVTGESSLIIVGTASGLGSVPLLWNTRFELIELTQDGWKSFFWRQSQSNSKVSANKLQIKDVNEADGFQNFFCVIEAFENKIKSQNTDRQPQSSYCLRPAVAAPQRGRTLSLQG